MKSKAFFKCKKTVLVWKINPFLLTGSFFFVVTCLLVFSATSADAATLSLMTTKTSAVNTDVIPVNIKMNTSSANMVVTRAIIRYNTNAVSVENSDVSLAGSIFSTSNTCTFPNDFSTNSVYVNDTALNLVLNAAARLALQGQPCQIISNDATNGILSITLAMPSSTAATAPGAPINGENLQVALVNFHAKTTIPATLTQKTIALAYISPIGAVANSTDSDVIADDQVGTDALVSVGQISSAMFGDLNMDGIIDISDFSILKANFDNAVCGNRADIMGTDCTVDISDFSQLKSNFDHIY